MPDYTILDPKDPTAPVINLMLGQDGDGLGVFCGIIILAKTGLLWENQVGGCSCNHPNAEGFFVPLEPKNCVDPLEDLRGIPYDPELVWKFLGAAGLQGILEPLEAEHPTAVEWGLQEAWVPVRVSQAEGTDRLFNPMLYDLAGMVGIVTYTNSD